jgi:hypothetical protein
MPKLRNPTEFFSGLFLAATAAAFWWLARDLEMGTVTQMGPAYAPTLLSYCLFGIGVAVMVIGMTRDGEPIPAVSWRPAVIILASVLFFALAIEHLGLPLTVIGTVMISGLATPLSHHVQNAILACFLAAAVALVFVVGLGLQIPIWPAGWGH